MSLSNKPYVLVKAVTGGTNIYLPKKLENIFVEKGKKNNGITLIA
jgi:hypothetical protein